MPERLTQNRITSDSSRFSLREEAFNLVKGEDGFYADKVTKEKFSKIDSTARPEFQKLAALILKGVINVSDIIKVGNNYYSHVQDFENIRSSNTNIMAEMQSDIIIIETVLEDNDHTFGDSFRFVPGEDSNFEVHNLRIDRKNGKLNFFDFGPAFPEEMYTGKENLSELEALLEENIMSDEFNIYFIKEILEKKIKILLSLYKESDFENFKKIIQKSGVKLKKDEQMILFYNIRLRLKALSNVLSRLES